MHTNWPTLQTPKQNASDGAHLNAKQQTEQ